MKKFLKSTDFAPNEIVGLYDQVLLGNDLYLVDGFSLSLCSGEVDNDRIFDLLEIKDKKEFCKEAYGYDPLWHYGFPRPKSGDYEALTRVTIALMERSEHPTIRLRLTKFVKKHF